MSENRWAKRALECNHWRWAPGMLTTLGMRVIESTQECIIGYGDGLEDRVVGASDIPDFTDPATLGCLTQLARDALGSQSFHAADWVQGDYDSEAHKLVTALIIMDDH